MDDLSVEVSGWVNVTDDDGKRLQGEEAELGTVSIFIQETCFLKLQFTCFLKQ